MWIGRTRVIFPPGVTRVPFDVLINNDDESEHKEHIILIIKKNSLLSGITFGRNRRATVTITD